MPDSAQDPAICQSMFIHPGTIHRSVLNTKPGFQKPEILCCKARKTYWAAHDTSSVFPTCDCNQGQSPESTDFRQSTLVFVKVNRISSSRHSNDLTFRNCAQVAPTRHGPSRCAASVSRHWQTPSRTPSWTKVWKFPIKSTNCLIWNVLKSHKISVYFLVSSGLIPT